MATEETIERAKDLLVEATGGKVKVILFGSHARGDAGPDSDLDLLVVLPEVESRASEWKRLRVALRPLKTPIDLIVASEQYVSDWGPVVNTVINEALTEGQTLYAK